MPGTARTHASLHAALIHTQGDLFGRPVGTRDQDSQSLVFCGPDNWTQDPFSKDESASGCQGCSNSLPPFSSKPFFSTHFSSSSGSEQNRIRDIFHRSGVSSFMAPDQKQHHALAQPSPVRLNHVFPSMTASPGPVSSLYTQS